MKKLVIMAVAVLAASSLFAQSWDWTVDAFQTIDTPFGTPSDGEGFGWYIEVIGGNTTGGNTDVTTGWYGAYYLSESFTFNADEGTDVTLVLWNSSTPDTGWYIESAPTTLATGLSAPPTDSVSFDFSSSEWVAVPEPATVGLFGLGALSAWFIRRSKKAQEEA